MSVSPGCAGCDPEPSNWTVSGGLPHVTSDVATAWSPYSMRRTLPAVVIDVVEVAVGPELDVDGALGRADANAATVEGSGLPPASGKMTHMQWRA